MRMIAGAFLSLLLLTGAETAPQRIVSMNLCTDALVLELAPRESIVSVSFLAVDPDLSPKAREAQGIPLNRGQAEEILALEPDLVVAGRYTKRSAVALLQRLGVPLIELDIPNSIAATQSHIRRLARALGQIDRGEAVIAQLDARLNAIKPSDEHPLGLIYHPNGFTTGAGTLVDELLARAGIDNLAAHNGLSGWGNQSLEQILLAAPDLLIFVNSGDQQPAIAREILEHPAMRHLRSQILAVDIPGHYWLCAGPWMVEAVERLAEVRQRWSHNRDARP